MSNITLEDLLEAKKKLGEQHKQPTLMACTHYFNGIPEDHRLKDNKNQKFCEDCFDDILNYIEAK